MGVNRENLIFLNGRPFTEVINNIGTEWGFGGWKIWQFLGKHLRFCRSLGIHSVNEDSLKAGLIVSRK